MADASGGRERYSAGDLTIDAGARRVLRGDRKIRLPGLSFDLLLELVRAAPDVVSVDQLMDRVWPDRVVNPETVGKRATLLREALGEDIDDPRYILVERGRGYRWLTPVTPITDEHETRSVSAAGARRWRTWALAGALAALLLYAMNLRIELPGEATGDTASSSDRPAANSLAVLPFADMSPAGDQEYFADGLAEEIIHLLAQIESLKVIGRTSSFAFKDKDAGIPQIGKMLGVNHILEGSVRKSGDRLRITAQLVKAGDGSHLWSETYDRQLRDIFEIQTDVAVQIVEALQVEITPAERAGLARHSTASHEAYTLYLKGRYFWNRRTAEGLALAVDYFERAIESDPQYPLAYAGLASAIGPMSKLDYIHPREARERRRDAAYRAVELDEGLAEAHAVLAGYLHINEWDFAESEREFLRAIELNPNNSTAHHWYGHLLYTQGRFDEALVQKRLALELDPLAPIHTSSLAQILRLLGEPDLAVERYREALELDPGFWHAHVGLGRLHEGNGDFEEAIRAFEKAVAQAGPTQRPKAGLARVLALTGREKAARRIVDTLKAEANRNDIYTPEVASALYALGDADAAYEWLEAAYRQRHPNLPQVWLESGATGMEDDPRFRQLLQRIGLDL